MNVLITGHEGYIGPVMIRAFRRAGHRVVGLDTGYFRNCMTAGMWKAEPEHELDRDIRDVESSDLVGIDTVIHLAALSNDPLGELNSFLTDEINLRAGMRLAIIAKQAGVKRFIFASSCSLYGAADVAKPLDENAPLKPVSAYAVSKVRMEEELSLLADEAFSPVYLRNATAYGVSPKMRFDLVLNNLMGWARTTGTIRVLSDGTPWRPLVHIEDIAAAALAAAESPQEDVHNEAFNVGRTDSNYQVRQIAEMVGDVVAGSRVLITGETGGDPRSYRVDFSKAENGLTGFEPQWTLERGCEELDRWFSDGYLGSEDFQSRTYVRLKQLKHLMKTGRIDNNLRFRSVVEVLGGKPL